LDALEGGANDDVTCGVGGLTDERGGLGTTPLIFDRAPGVIRGLTDHEIVIEVIPNGVMVEFAWPTDNGPLNFSKDEAVHLTRQTHWDSATQTTVDVASITGSQLQAVFVSARRVLPEGLGNDVLALETPIGNLEMGPVECERVRAAGCEVEREQRLGATLADGSVVASDAPLSRESILLDWARGSRVGAVAGCGGAPSTGIEETLEVAYFAPAPPPESAPLANVLDRIGEI
jgi:hypothetical protein